MKKFEVIELLRFIAALSVVFVHIPFIGIGDFGVDIFFIISGFVMMLSTQIKYDKFFLKRLIRICPTYYLFTFGVFLIAIFSPHLLNNTTADLTHLLKSLLFIPFDKNNGHYPILFLGWTLNYEMYFYFLFAICLKISHQYRGILTTLLIFAIWYVASNYNNFILNVYSNLIVFEFVLGILLYIILIERSFKQSAIILITIVLVHLISTKGIDHRFYYYGLPSVILIYIILKVFRKISLHKSIITLGGSSYALYLTHPYIIQLFDKTTHWFYGSAIEKISALIISLILTNIFAIITFRFIETPLILKLREKLIKHNK